MNTFLVLAAVLGVVAADIGLGYHYKVPQTSYGVPSYQTSGSTGGSYNTGYSSGGSGYNYKGQSAGQAGYQGSNVNAGYQGGYSGVQSGVSGGADYQGSSSSGVGYQGSSASGVGYQGNSASGVGFQSSSAGSTGYQTGGVGSTGYQTSSQYYPSTGSSASNIGSSSIVQPSYQVGGNAGQGSYQYQTSNQYQTSSQAKYQQQYQIQQQPAQVFKHFYVHAAPEEPEVFKPRNPVVLPAPQKHYKIIFIKTPAQAGGAPQFVPVQQQNEEKTIVYVLVKKPEDYQDVVVPKVEQKPPTKPEVYFIKYNSKEDSQAVINNIVNDYNNKGQSVSFAGAGSEAAEGVTSNGYYSGQSVLGSGVSSTPSYSSSTVSYPEHASLGIGPVSTQTESQVASSLGSSFGQGSQSENQASSNFGSVFGSGSTGSLSIATADATGSSLGNGYDSGFASSTANYDHVNTISTSQGVPHETYGVPKFKTN